MSMKIEEDDEKDLRSKRKAKVSANEPRKGKVSLWSDKRCN